MLRSATTPTIRRLATRLQPSLGVAPVLARGIVTIVQQGNIAYRLTLGRNPTLLTPGLSLYVPVIHSIRHVDMRERSVNIDSLGCYTSENVPVSVSGSLFYRVVDGEKAVFGVQDYEGATAAIGTSALRSTVGHFSYDELISNRTLLNSKLQTTIGNSVAEWGIECSKFEVQNFHPSNREVEKQLEQQMEAERNRRRQLLDTEALVNVAEGQKKRTILNSEAELQSRLNEAEGQFATTAKEGEALAAQISLVARSLAGGEGGEPTTEQLARAAELIIELRRQEMLKAVAQGEGNHTYFLNEEMGRAELETDASERWKRSLPRMAEANST